MSAEKSIVPNLEGEEVDNFGSPELNTLFKSLDAKTQVEIKKYPEKVQIEILTNIANPELKQVYDSLSSKAKQNVDSLKIRDKYIVLRDMLKTKKAKLQEEGKEPLPIKESTYDFGSPELNKFYSDLGPSVQDEIKNIKDDNGVISKEEQIATLKRMSNPEIQEYYRNLTSVLKLHYDKMNINQKYKLLEAALNQNKIYKEIASESVLIEPEELEEELEQAIPIEKKQGSPQLAFDKLVQKYYSVSPYVNNYNTNHELEVKFGTKGIKSITRNDYDNVIRKLKSFGFTTTNNIGNYMLRINCEYLDSTTGRFKRSDIRTEISGLHNIEDYCKNNDLKSIYKISPNSVQFISKKIGQINNERIFPVNFDDFNFRVSYQTEIVPKIGIIHFTLENWKKSKKEFRFINRVSFEHPDYPFIVDISIVKYGNKGPDKYGREGRGNMIFVYTIEESNVFNNSETYEIEIEVNNKKIGPGTKFNTPLLIVESLRKIIKYVLGALQGTNYPISYPEQTETLESYMKLIWGDEYEPNKRIGNQYFIGPNSITLQIINISPIDDNSNEPNIRKDFVVTDKADGSRHLMYVSNKGKIYLINTNMDIIFTGAKTMNEKCFNTILDGELISKDKNGVFINLYAAFDIYYFQKKDVRSLTFMLFKEEKDVNKSRYYLLKNYIASLNPVSVMTVENTESKGKSVGEIIKNNKDANLFSPIRVVAKEFFPMSSKQDIFRGCEEILRKQRENRYEYNTDGLIFTHSYYGVGADDIGKAGPKTKITWTQSFKWKPPQYNTIDFLVTTMKDATGKDIVKPIFEDGISADSSVQFSEYKSIELRCGFSEKNDGYINPCQDIIDDKLPEFSQRFEDRQKNDYLPKRFYPTEPYDPKAGLCKIMLRIDDSGVKQMFTEENESFSDNTIVEFRYDFDRQEGWRWVPLRVRYDKTARYLKGEKEYGNAYKVANENWKSIHPAGRIDEDMLCTGLNIPDLYVSEDKYYNTPGGKLKTESMKNFHNLYVKKMLIKSVSKPGDTLIDYACGKAGDLSKWIASKLSFVFGIDYSKDNLENRLDGACCRFLKSKKVNKNVPYALFVHGNSSFNIKNGNAMLNDKAKQITAAIFGNGPKDPEKIGKGVARQYGKHDDGFNISSCQFAIHYFLENPDTLQGFMTNLAECTKLNGYFIGTAYDGKIVFDLLRKTKTGDGVKINDPNDGKKIWEIIKGYGADTFEDDSSCIGYRIDVYQESINQLIAEYLVNFDYLNRVMDNYGFKLINREEANEIGLPDGTGLFSELFMNMLEEISKNRFKASDYGEAPNMSALEKKISFLNRYFVYKKYKEVNVKKVILELSEYNETENLRDTKQAVEVAEDENKKLKPKVRKLSKKLLLIPATEAVEEKPGPAIVEKEMKKTAVKKTVKEQEPKKKILLIEESDEEN